LNEEEKDNGGWRRRLNREDKYNGGCRKRLNDG
jgi:hypothetical protein